MCCGGKLDNEDMYFSAQSGGTLCLECKKHTFKSTKLHHKIRDFLVTLLQLDFDKKTRYDELATERICDFCFELLKEHIEQHSPKKIKSSEMLTITK